MYRHHNPSEDILYHKISPHSHLPLWRKIATFHNYVTSPAPKPSHISVPNLLDEDAEPLSFTKAEIFFQPPPTMRPPNPCPTARARTSPPEIDLGDKISFSAISYLVVKSWLVFIDAALSRLGIKEYIASFMVTMGVKS